MKHGGSRNAVFRRKLLAASVAACFAVSASQLSAQVLPTGATGVVGVTGISQAGSTLTVNTTGNSVLNYTSFSIGAGATVQINQQSAAMASLQRVVGAGGVIPQSVIDGMLKSNGRVFLLNPSGIVIGAGARIDVAGFVASSLNMSDEDFLKGRLRFTENAAAQAVKNFGEITTTKGGHVYLVAPEVENHGIIRAPQGQIILAAGKSAELISDASPYVTVKVVADVEKALNVGKLIADSGSIGMFGALVRHSGEAEAGGAIVGPGGQIRFVATKDLTIDAGSRIAANGTSGGQVVLQAEGGTNLIAGTVEAKGSTGKGGEVQALGVRVGVIGNGIIDASGEAGGGTVLVGGDYQGKNSAIQNAERTLIGADGVIRADAGANGDGGRVIVWADGDTRFYGHISAQGGSQSGNGGFVETSGKGSLQAFGRVNVSAAKGTAGTWLLDPEDLEVVEGPYGSASGDSLVYFDGQITFGEIGPYGSQVSRGAIEGYGGNVLLQANNDITFSTSIDKDNGGLSVDAGNDVNLGNNTIKVYGNLSVFAGGSIKSSQPASQLVARDGSVNLNAGVDVIVGGMTTESVYGGAPQNVTIIAQTGDISTGAIKTGNTFNGDSNVQLWSYAGRVDTGDISTGYSSSNRNINIIASTGVSTGNLTTRSDEPGFNGGSVSLSTGSGSVVVSGTIDTSGAIGSNFDDNTDGSNAGSVSINAGSSSISVTGSILARGGNGNYYGDTFGNSVGWGGAGGSVSLTAYGFGSISTGSINTSGGHGGNGTLTGGGDGGNGGSVFINASGAVSIDSITTSGGSGGSESISGMGGHGRSAGSITVNGASIVLAQFGSARGGAGGAGADGGEGGNGGGGGSINMRALSGALTTGDLDVSGGNAGAGGADFVGHGGWGGLIDLTSAGAMTTTFLVGRGGAGSSATSSLSTSNGHFGGEGGEGARITIAASGGWTAGPAATVGLARTVVDIRGGDGGNGGPGASPGGDGGNGGNGGSFYFDAPNMTINGVIVSTGGAGGAGGAGAGGYGNGVTGIGGNGAAQGAEFYTGGTGIITFVNGGWDLTAGAGGTNGVVFGPVPVELSAARFVHIGPGDLADIPVDTVGIFRFTAVADPLAIAAVAQQVGLTQSQNPESGSGESNEEEDTEKEKTGSLGSCRPS